MTTRFVVPTLALLAAIPAAHAFDIAGDGWELSIEPRIQSRIEFGSNSSAGGDDIDPWNGDVTDNPRTVNFYMRRARIYFKGKSDDGWKFNYTIQADGIGIGEDNRSGSRGGDDRDNADISVRYATVGREFGDEQIEHYLQFGLDKHTSNQADVDSSSTQLFPNGRYAARYAGPRSIGLDYQLSHEIFNLRAGIADSAGDENNDYYFYIRGATPLSAEWALPKRRESYLGKEGFGHELGLGFDFIIDGSDANDPAAAAAAVSSQGGTEDDADFVVNLDYLVHYNEITALLDFSYISRDEANGDNSGMIISAQGAYAIALENGTVAEPALRIALIDNDDDDDDEMGTLVREGGDSGLYIDAGLNYYLDGHSNKFQAALQFYSPEEGDGDGVMFRLAHQLDF